MRPEEEDFIELTRQRAKDTVQKIKELTHELARLKMEQARTAQYIHALNEFLISEGQEPVPFEEALK